MAEKLQKLQSINLPTNVLLCSEINCSSKVHFQQLNKYVTYVTESCISAAESVIPRTCRRHKVVSVSRLKAHKNDGSTGLTSDHINNAGIEYYTRTWLSCLRQL